MMPHSNKEFMKLSKTEELWLRNRGIKVEKLVGDELLVTEDLGFQLSKDKNVLMEISNLITRFMNKYDIGKHLSSKKWSKTAQDQVRTGLRQVFDNFTNQPTASPLQVYDEIRNRVADKYSPGDVATVARTEAAKMRGVLQLLNWKEAGVEEVIYVARPGARPSHAALNGKRFKISELLEDEDKRIPISVNGQFDGYNCRCRYRPHIPGFRPRN